VRGPRPGALALTVALLLLALAAPAAHAQGDRSILLVLDSSKSMNEDAGNGSTRLDAAKSAVDELVKALPQDAQVGLRVYGARVAESSRAAGCRDSQLVVPVGPLDRDALRARVQALDGRGRTPIGRSLKAAAQDLPAGGRRTLILVSDGGDNCAPPDPCKAAADVSKQGVKLNISVVGLQVNDRVRRQLRCIAEAGGGTYVDARDPNALRDELLAAIARAFRDYTPVGTPVEGGPDAGQAAAVARGQYVDNLQPGDERFYAVPVKRGQRLYAAATAIPPRNFGGTAGFRMELLDPSGKPVTNTDLVQVRSAADVISSAGAKTLSLRAPASARDGVYRLHLSFEGDTEAVTIPVELAIQPLDPGQRPAFVRPPGPLSTALGAKAPGGGPTATPTPAPQPEQAEDSASPSAPALAGAGIGGLLVGLFGGRALLRRRRT
jgi:Ca-activated chloride channel homolog